MWCKIVVLVFCCFFFFASKICWRDYPLSIICSLLCHKLWPYTNGFNSGLSILFHWSMIFFFFFSASTMLFLLLWLCSSLKSGSWITSALFFFLEITLAIWDCLWFHANFRIFISFLWNVFWIVIDCSLHCSPNL